MTGPDDDAELREMARRVIDQNRYLVLGTVEPDGRPRLSPVFFTPARYRDFYWVSSPDATHSVNIAVRPEVGIAIFDSQAAIGVGQGVYMSATATLLEGDEAARGIEAFSARSAAHGAQAWTAQDVWPGAGLRLYRATADSYSILAKDGRPDHRIAVPLGGPALVGQGAA